ncbi:hypothetical protein MPSEU_000613800 [Mayamaea pseudoterrestris]|nr:hypothetical protein MPSEU_000613800 [Mayamaea pseudoterrestris]
MRLLPVVSLTLLASSVDASDYPVHVQIPRQIRRFLNLNSLFGSATQSDTPYDRVGGHPVFSVTTPWGSPYMNMEKVSGLDQDTARTSGNKPQSVTDESNEFRTVCLYFMDPDDALGVHGEMKQMENMQSADLRLTSFSLAKALRQASNLGGGLLTGQPPDPLTGSLPSDSGSLRYKIVPPKRQLYYAARCIGRERVGLFSDNPTEDAQAAVLGTSAIDATRLERRRTKQESKMNRQKKQTAMQAANAHMDGYTGIPVFWNPQMQKRLPLIKRLTTGVQHEIPMFFNYEDMQSAWQTLRSRNKKAIVAEEPAGVQVFNLMDLLTSIDRDECARKQRQSIRDKLLQPLKNRFISQSGPDLQHVTFIPSSRSIQYKEAMSARGNGKCRLRPMR